MGYPVYIANLSTTVSKSKILNLVKQCGEISPYQQWHKHNGFLILKVCFLVKENAKKFMGLFPTPEFPNAKIYCRQVCWACQFNNPKYIHSKKCLSNQQSQSQATDISNKSIKTQSPQFKRKQSRNTIVGQTVNLAIQMKVKGTDEKPRKQQNNLIFITKDQQIIELKTHQAIKLSDIQYLGDNYGNMMKVVGSYQEPEPPSRAIHPKIDRQPSIEKYRRKSKEKQKKNEKVQEQMKYPLITHKQREPNNSYESNRKPPLPHKKSRELNQKLNPNNFQELLHSEDQQISYQFLEMLQQLKQMKANKMSSRI